MLRYPSPDQRRRDSVFKPTVLLAFALGFTLALAFSSQATIPSGFDATRRAGSGHSGLPARAGSLHQTLNTAGHKDGGKVLAFIGVQVSFYSNCA